MVAHVDAHAPHVVDASATGEPLDASDVVAPLPEHLPPHRLIFA